MIHGLIAQQAANIGENRNQIVGCLLGIGAMADWNSRLSGWMQHATNEKGNNTFCNQALNTLFNYSTRPFVKIRPTMETFDKIVDINFKGSGSTSLEDARDISHNCDLWITDPPYADAINYHELGDFFLAWYDKQLAKVFPEWVSDARAELAVRGDGEDFRRSMVEIYQNLARHMPDNGMQMVMFTHQDPSVWADLGMILWAAGLKATAAWTISTETAAGLKQGNYVQGTVCLVLRKRVSRNPASWTRCIRSLRMRLNAR
ncbi:MAG: hypothetical protein IPF48_05935 [Sphingomonadales bacterium]|nr:hypothetical protein [Sphingomonadales bacterium]